MAAQTIPISNCRIPRTTGPASHGDPVTRLRHKQRPRDARHPSRLATATPQRSMTRPPPQITENRMAGRPTYFNMPAAAVTNGNHGADGMRLTVACDASAFDAKPFSASFFTLSGQQRKFFSETHIPKINPNAKGVAKGSPGFLNGRFFNPNGVAERNAISSGGATAASNETLRPQRPFPRSAIPSGLYSCRRPTRGSRIPGFPAESRWDSDQKTIENGDDRNINSLKRRNPDRQNSFPAKTDPDLSSGCVSVIIQFSISG